MSWLCFVYTFLGKEFFLAISLLEECWYEYYCLCKKGQEDGWTLNVYLSSWLLWAALFYIMTVSYIVYA